MAAENDLLSFMEQFVLYCYMIEGPDGFPISASPSGEVYQHIWTKKSLADEMCRVRFAEGGYQVVRLGYQELVGVLMNGKNDGVTHVTVDRQENKNVVVVPVLEMIQQVGRSLAKAEAGSARASHAQEANSVDISSATTPSTLNLSFITIERAKDLRRKDPMFIADILLSDSIDEMAALLDRVRSLESTLTKEAIAATLATAAKADAAQLGVNLTDDQAIAIALWKGFGTQLRSDQLGHCKESCVS
jgi:hypothetical protein